MQLLIDLATMAVMHSSGVPLTDLALVRGDKQPLRITMLDDGVPVTPSGVRPALAIKTALGDGALVLAATDLEPVDDALGLAYVGSLSVNTTQLAEAMGQDDRIDLVGELVLISGDGSQRTSSLIRVGVRQDIMPADIVPPQDVVTDWEEMVAASLAAQLPDALHKAGMYVTTQGGTTTLATDMTPYHRRDVTYYRLPLSHRNIVGHLSSNYTINSVTLRSTPSAVPVCIEIHKLVNDSYTLLGRSINAIAPSNANQDYTWIYPPGLTVRSDDTIILRVVRTDGTDAVLSLAITQVGAHNPESGADIVDGLVDPQRIINPDYPGTRFLLYTRIRVAYTDGVAVGGVELATKDDFNDLTANVIETGEQVHADAAEVEANKQAAQQAAETAHQAASVIQISYANITQSPPDGARDNYYAYGWIVVTASSGRLDTITLQPRSAGSVTDTWPIWLKVWTQEGNTWRLLGTSVNAVVQTAGTPSVWQFSGLTLNAGQRIRVDAHKTEDGTAYDTRLAVRVVLNTAPNTGIINNQGVISAANWMPIYTLALTTATGVTAHDIHLADQADLDAHTQDAVAHVTAEDRQRWDASGGMYYADMEITADNSINGLLIPPDAPSGWYEVRVALNFTSADGRPVSVYTYSGTSDPVYDWDGYMTIKYAPWYKATPIPQHATREPSGLELRYDWWDASASLSDMGCILYICHTQGVASPICGVSGAPADVTNLGHMVVRQLTTLNS